MGRKMLHTHRYRICFSSLAVAFGFSLAIIVAPVAASAQDYPTKPIRMLVGFAPGAAADLLARIIADPMSKILGQPIIVEARPGANSALASRLMVQSAPDGHTILLMASAMVSNLHGMKDPGYKMSDFTAIGGLVESPFTMMVNTNTTKVKTLKDVIALAKAEPDKLTYGSLGPSSPANLASSRLAKAAGFKWREIPFKSGSDANLAISAGTIDVYFAAPATALPVLRGQPHVVAVAVTGKERNAQVPEASTFSDQGYDIQDWFSYGLMAPAGTPKPILDKLRNAFVTVRATDEAKKRIEASGLNIYLGDPDKYYADLMAQYVTFEKDFKELGIEKE
jgi:tripartite-type tricarboxylate transporter receptor subunit TctC